MIVIWEKFAQVWTNFGNLIENFKSFAENFNKNLENFKENLKYVLIIDSHSLSSKTFVFGGNDLQVPTLEPLLTVFSNHI